MKALLLITLLAACVALSFADSDPTVSLPNVHDLTPQNFDKFVNGGKHALVEFYAPWCGHCKRMVGEYKRLAEFVQANPKLKSRVVIAKVDADAHRELGQKFGVQGFPTIKYFQRGKPVDAANAQSYDQARTADQMLEYLQQKVDEDSGYAQVPALAELAKKFGLATAADRTALIAEAIEKAKDVAADVKDNAQLYINIMQKAATKGADYLQQEKARLDRLIGSGSVAAAKLEQMAKKSSVISAFLPETDEE